MGHTRAQMAVPAPPSPSLGVSQRRGESEVPALPYVDTATSSQTLRGSGPPNRTKPLTLGVWDRQGGEGR